MSQETYYTAKKLAGLPGMPNTESAVIRKAKKENWLHRDRAGRGGGREYSITSLPEETRAALATANTKVGYEESPVLKQVARDASAIKAQADKSERLRAEARAQSLATFSRLPEEKQLPAKAKLACITACHRYITGHRLQLTAGQSSFCHEYRLGRIDVAPWVREQVRSIHPATLRGWITDEYQLGIMGLVDCYGNRKDQGKIETWQRTVLPDGTVKAPMADLIAALVIKNPSLRGKKCNEAMRSRLPDAPRVDDKTVQRFVDKWKAQNAHLFALASNPDDYKNRFQPAFGSRSEGIAGPNQRWEIDATPADLLLTDGRYKIISVCDVGPRRLKLYVTKTERTRDNAYALRLCLLDWGVPYRGVLVTDQGSPYVNPRFEVLLSDLEIDQHICQPFSGDEKPHVERAFRTFSHDLLELLPGYCGHNVAERKAIESRKSFAQRLKDPDAVIEMSMSSEDLQAFCDRWCASYHDTKHSELGLTPNEVMQSWPQPIHKIADERALDVLLYEPVRPGKRLPIIGKKGIRVNGPHYIHELLADHIGEHCRAYQDPSSLGRIVVYLSNRHGIWEYLCIATAPDLDQHGIRREEVARAAREIHKERKKQINRLVNAAKRELKGVDLVDAVLTMRENDAQAARGNVVHLPHQTVEYTSAGLVAAGDAFAALTALDAPAEDAPQYAEDAIEAAGRRWVELSEARETEGKVIPLPTASRPMFGTDLEKYRWLKANLVLQGYDDARWMGWYEGTTEYALMFGEASAEDGC